MFKAIAQLASSLFSPRPAPLSPSAAAIRERCAQTLARHDATVRAAADNLQRAQWQAEYALRLLAQCQADSAAAAAAAALAEREAPLLIALAEMEERKAALLREWAQLHNEDSAAPPATDVVAPPPEGFPLPASQAPAGETLPLPDGFLGDAPPDATSAAPAPAKGKRQRKPRRPAEVLNGQSATAPLS